ISGLDCPQTTSRCNWPAQPAYFGEKRAETSSSASVAQGCSAGDTGVGAVVSGEQRNFAAARIDAPTGDACAKFIKERPQHAGDTAANYDYVGFQQIDGVSQINCQEFNGFEQRSCGEGITACMCLIHEFSSDCGDFSASQIEHRRVGQVGGLQFCLSTFGDSGS